KPPGGHAIDANDYPVERSVYALRNVDALRRQAEQAGAVVGRFAAALLDSPLPWTRMRRAYALLGLVRRYGAARVTEACTVALAADMLDVRRLQRMLEHGAITALAVLTEKSVRVRRSSTDSDVARSCPYIATSIVQSDDHSREVRFVASIRRM